MFRRKAILIYRIQSHDLCPAHFSPFLCYFLKQILIESKIRIIFVCRIGTFDLLKYNSNRTYGLTIFISQSVLNSGLIRFCLSKRANSLFCFSHFFFLFTRYKSANVILQHHACDICRKLINLSMLSLPYIF